MRGSTLMVLVEEVIVVVSAAMVGLTFRFILFVSDIRLKAAALELQSYVLSGYFKLCEKRPFLC